MTWVKICGLTREEDVEAVVEAGADAVGFIRHKSSPRFIALEDAKRLAVRAGELQKLLVYRAMREDETLDEKSWGQAEEFEAKGLQPDRKVLVLRPEPEAQVSVLLDKIDQPTVRAVLLDAYDPFAGGGTGRRVDPGFAAEFVAACPVPVILAGGLRPDNVAEAIRAVRPWGIDVSSGVEERAGIKDRAKIRDFMAAARSV
ncbi:MAG: phosphoribosylanthranilate isomerase [Fimbriimonadaceae bacterium]|nr:phosphoribosylanthranilate isomerase [Fimbriimonadaceae bacterium]QYK57061.1 MAG: phosphoribosylanthranilate isomerase [Fimbriimonadaceae bacterium]